MTDSNDVFDDSWDKLASASAPPAKPPDDGEPDHYFATIIVQPVEAAHRQELEAIVNDACAEIERRLNERVPVAKSVPDHGFRAASQLVPIPFGAAATFDNDSGLGGSW